MRILFTGATGVLGREAVPGLIDAGHQVVGVARREEDHRWLESVGAEPVHLDLFDKTQVTEVVAGKDAVIHFATAIPPMSKMRSRKSWSMNDALRSVATGLLVDAAIGARVGVFVQQSVTLVYADSGEAWIDETTPVRPHWEVLASALDAERHVERFTQAGGRGVVLRLSNLYGPGRASEEYLEAVAQRKVPIVGDGNNYVSRLHVADAGRAIVAALDVPAGLYNVSEDVPATAADGLRAVADALGAPPPRSVPTAAVRLAMGKMTSLLTMSQRIANDRFKTETGWVPLYPASTSGWTQVVRPGKHGGVRSLP